MASQQKQVNISGMNPTQKVAALLIVLGPKAATEILRNIPDEDLIEQITLEIANLNKVPLETLDSILEEFFSIFQASGFISRGGIDYAKMLLEEAYGSDKAGNILDKLVTILNSTPFQFFNDADAMQLATSFQNENPQLIALILAYLKPEKSAAVLNNLPTDVQAAVAFKIAEMESTNPEIISDIEKIVENKFSSVVIQDFSKAGGIEALATILNRADRATEKKIMESIESKNHDLVEQIKDLMFVFEDIVKLEDRAVQRVLREVDNKDLALSLKGSNQDVKDKIFKNMSERARTMLVDDMEYMGPVRAKDVQECQSKIVNIIRLLESTGEIVVARSGSEDEYIE